MRKKYTLVTKSDHTPNLVFRDSSKASISLSALPAITHTKNFSIQRSLPLFLPRKKAWMIKPEEFPTVSSSNGIITSREIQTGAINAASAMAELYFEKHEEKLILLRLASIALKWLELQKWKTSDPTQDFYHFSQFMKSLPIAKKLDFTMKTLSDDEESSQHYNNGLKPNIKPSHVDKKKSN